MKSSMKPPTEITPEIIATGLSIYHPGFTSGSCGKCKKTANFPAGGRGFICTCGHFNIGMISGVFIPHEMPDLGPSRQTIKDAYKYKKETDEGFRRFWDGINPINKGEKCSERQ